MTCIILLHSLAMPSRWTLKFPAHVASVLDVLAEYVAGIKIMLQVL